LSYYFIVFIGKLYNNLAKKARGEVLFLILAKKKRQTVAQIEFSGWCL